MSRPKSKHANNHGIDKRSNTEKLFDDELAVPAPPMMLDIGEERLKLLQKNILSVLCKGCKCCSSVNSVLTETVTFESLLKSENFEKTKPSPKLSTMSPLNMTDRTATEKSSEIINVISNIYVTKSSPKKRSDMKVNLNTRNIKNINEAVLSNSKSDSEVSATEEDNINNATDVGINANIQSQPQKPQSDKKKKRKKRKALYTYFAKGNTKSRKSGADKTSALQAKQSESSDQEPSKGKKRKSLGEDKEVPNGKKKKQEVENIKPENSKEKPKKSDLVKSQKIDKSQIKSQPVKRQSKKKLVAQKLQFSSEEEIVEKSSLENQKQVKGKSSQRGPKGMEKGDSLEVPQEASKNFKANRTYSAKKQTNSGSDLGAKRKTRKVKKVGSPQVSQRPTEVLMHKKNLIKNNTKKQHSIYTLIDHKEFKINLDSSKTETFSKEVLRRLSRRGGVGLSLGASFLEEQSLRLDPVSKKKTLYSPERWLHSKVFDGMCRYSN